MDDRPHLRPIEAFPVQQDGKTFLCLRDPQRLSPALVVSPATYFIISHFDGKHSLIEVQEAYCRLLGEMLVSDDLRKIVDLLDGQLYLYSERYFQRQREILEEFRRLPTRAAAHAGTVYKESPSEFTAQIDNYFQLPQGPGEPKHDTKRRLPRAIVAPHIDFHRGGPCYAWAYKSLAEAPGADLYILLGTSHYGGRNPFIATLKDFATPLGVVETDKDFVGELQGHYSNDLFADEYLHRTEHSLEFQVVFLQYLAQFRAKIAGEDRPFKIVPILVSSFHTMVQSQTLPEKDPAIGNFLRALRELLEKEARQVCLIAGVDLAHIGMQFGDREPITPQFLKWVEDEDVKLIERLELGDSQGFFHEIAKDQDRRRICGFSPLYSLIHLLDGSRGRCVKYSQAFTRETGSAVTFTSVVFD
jgi:AmmeMemoRadiSam system protein B